MNYSTLLDLVTEMGHRLAMAGAETFRVEESVSRILSVYGIEAEVFAITNCMIISITTPDGTPMTRMRRIGFHGTDLDTVEHYSNLSRRICNDKPEPTIALQWLQQTASSLREYNLVMHLLGNFLGSFGFAILFGGTWADAICSGICGILVGLVNKLMNHLKVNPFFSTVFASFVIGMAAFALGTAGFANNTDTVAIGALMLLVPGLLFTNAMRDIIFGDTNSGVNRIVQVLLIAAAIALGTGASLTVFNFLWHHVTVSEPLIHPAWIQCLGAAIGCIGFSIFFNIHGPGGLLCTLGGILSWASYLFIMHFTGNEVGSFFIAAIVSAVYAEIMARIRKYPAISYLVVALFPLLPGAGIYYSANYLFQGTMDHFSEKAGQTIAIAGVLAVGVLMVSTIVRFITVWKSRKKQIS